MGIPAVIEGEGSGVIYRLGERVLTIGRSPANLIRLLDPSVSRRHATIFWDMAAYQIRDLQSKNGILVNEGPVVEAHLMYGDRVQVGQTLFKLTKDTGPVDQDSVLKRRVMSREAVDSATSKLDRQALKDALDTDSVPEPGAPSPGDGRHCHHPPPGPPESGRHTLRGDGGKGGDVPQALRGQRREGPSGLRRRGGARPGQQRTRGRGVCGLHAMQSPVLHRP
ncbi:MAG: FHA domain-containing protein [Deltaproteobacteria bacterium]|nr:FHA domain-containing protein [Deltaproteobacteria bacterium]